jgi:hypothetical protein
MKGCSNKIRKSTYTTKDKRSTMVDYVNVLVFGVKEVQRCKPSIREVV